MKTAAFKTAAVACLALGAAVARAEERTLSGKISDSLCGMSHKDMAAKQGSKITDRDCVIACLNYSTENSPKLVFVEKGGKVYQIANQNQPDLAKAAGDKVSVTGDVNGDTITVSRAGALCMEASGVICRPSLAHTWFPSTLKVVQRYSSRPES